MINRPQPSRTRPPLALLSLLALGACGGEADRTLVWVDEGDHRWAEVHPPRGDRVGFEVLDPAELGLDFENRLSEAQIVENRNLLNGSGVAVGDVTGDGRPDIYLARLDGPNRLYENLGGWRFRDITDAAGVGLPDQFSTGVTFADIDGNADLDLIVGANGAPTRLFLNDGSGAFSEVVGAFDTGRTWGTTSLALADIDADGDLDLYAANYKERSVRDLWPYEQEFRFIVERVDGEYRVRDQYRDHYRLETRDSVLVWFEEGEPDLLFRNEGDGRFTALPLDGGVLRDETGVPITEPLRDWGLHARFQDIDGDGRPDLYVANDFESPDRIWLNAGDGTFRAMPALSTRKGSLSSMAVDFSDVDRDGDTDFFVVEMLSRDHEKRLRQMGTMAPSPQPIGAIDNQPQYMGNTLFLNRGDGSYAEVSEQAGVRRSDWSWSTLFLDVDLDGYEDILVSTGHHYDVQDSDANQLIRNRTAMGRLDQERVMLLFPPLEVPNALFRNRGDGSFEEVTEDWGFREPDVSHGMATADFDGDGGPDLVVNRLGYPVAIYRNVTSAPRIRVRLRGLPPNTRGIGAAVRLLGAGVDQSKEIVAGGTYLSGSEPAAVFAPGSDGDGAGSEGPFTLEVTWPGGARSVIEGVRANRIYEIDQSGAVVPSTGEEVAGAPFAVDRHETTLGLFGQVPVDHVHAENAYPDFSYQPLHPYRLSRLGPGMAWFDGDGDGVDELFVGGGAESETARLRWTAEGLVRAVPGALSVSDGRDGAGIVGWWEEGVARLAVARSSQERAETPADEGDAVTIYGFDGGAPRRVGGVPAWGSSPGALAMADVDGDGRLDLFVGGRSERDRWPAPASSRLFLNRGGGRFEVDEGATAVLERIGLVTGAVFTDLDGDARPELVLAREWGTLMVLARDGDAWAEVSERWGMPSVAGWWNGVTAGDLDGDGRMDLVATNWGRNHLYASTSDADHPTRIRYGDLDGDGDVQVIETYDGGTSAGEVPRRSFSILWNEFPFIQDRMKTYEAFAASSVEEIFGGRLSETAMVEAAAFDHVAMLNRGDRFEVEPLPAEAQRAPAFHVSVADVDGDGHEDVVLSQNFFAYQLETPRSDAGRGLLLRGDGTGALAAVDAAESGIRVWGEQRGGALGDVDRDGRVDWAVSQNGAPTRLLRNLMGAQGLRVLLRGPATNPAGIGSQVRIETPSGSGPVREIHAGSGYWSMDSVVPVLAAPTGAATLWVRWPDGRERRYPVPAGATEIEAAIEGGESGGAP